MTFIVQLFVGLWVLFIAVAWCVNHYDYFDSYLHFSDGSFYALHALLPFLFTLGGALVVIALYYLRTKSFVLSLHYSWFLVSLGVLSLSTILFNLVAYIRIVPPYQEPLLSTVHWIAHNGIFLQKLLLTSLWIGAFSLAVYLLGHFVSRYSAPLRTIPSHNLRTLTFFALGLLLLTVITFFISLFGILVPVVFLFLLGVLVIVEYAAFKAVLHAMFTKRTTDIDFTHLTFWLSFIIFFIASITLIDVLRADPFDFDSSTYYLNRAYIMGQTGAIVSGGHPFPFELLSAIGYTFVDSAYLALANGLLYTTLGFLTLYGLTHKIIGDKRISLLIGTSWLILPMTQNFLVRDAKPDLLLFFIIALMLWFFYLWVLEKNRSSYIYLASIFLGFALTVKATAAFMLLALSFVALCSWTTWDASLNHKLKVALISILCGLLPLLLWVTFALYSSKESENTRLSKLWISTNSEAPSIGARTYASLGVDESQCTFTHADEDFGRYEITTTAFPLGVLVAPWSLTMNTNKIVASYPMNIGFVFLALLPLALPVAISKYDTKRKMICPYAVLLSVGTTVYWLAWYFFAHGILWYGYPGLIFFFLILGFLLRHYESVPKVKNTLIMCMFVNIIFLLSMRLLLFAEPPVVIYGASNFNTNATHYMKLMEILNNPQNSEGSVYLTASQSIYYIDHNDKRVLRDYYLDTFYCLDQGMNDVETRRRLQNLDMRYFIYTKSIPDLEISMTGTLHAKTDRFLNFAKTSLTLIHEEEEFMIFKLPLDISH